MISVGNFFNKLDQDMKNHYDSNEVQRNKDIKHKQSRQNGGFSELFILDLKNWSRLME